MTHESKHLFIAAAAVVLSAAGLAKAQTTVPAHLPRKGLVAFWTADGHAKDSLGKHHGTLQPGVTYTTGRHGKAKGAFGFNGKRGSVSIPDSAPLDTDDAFTLSAWVRPAGYRHNQGDRFSMILTKWYSSGVAGAGDYILALSTSGVPFVDILDRTAVIVMDTATAKSVAPTRAWTHVAATFNRGRLMLYVNGKLEANKTAKLKHTDRREYKNDNVVVGSFWKDGFYNFHGAIDEVGIWNRALSAWEVRALFGGHPTGLPHITRAASSDRIELIDRSVLIGKVESESYTITTASVGRVKIPAARVVGLVSGSKKDPRVRLVLSDSQVVVGKMSGQVLQLTLAQSSGVLKIPVGKILQFGYRITKDKPAAPVASGPLVILTGGDRLAWTECKQKLQLATASGVVDLAIDDMLNVGATDPAAREYRVVFRNGSTLTGTLLPEELTLKLQLGPTLTCPRGDVRSFVMLAKHVKPTGPATVRMRNGDRLFGKIADRKLTIRTEFGEVKVHAASVLTMTFDATKPTQVVAKMWGNTTIRGRLVQPTVTVAITPNGPAVKAKTTQIASITRSSVLPPPEVLKKAEQLIAQLGAESFEDRQAATEALIAMGKGIVPLLKKYLAETRDPEIRQRIQNILEQLGG